MKKILWLILLFAAPSAFGQGVPLPAYPAEKVVNGATVYMAPIPNATVTVCVGTAAPADGTICNTTLPLATLYSNATLTTAATNPANADSNGNINSLYIASGAYVTTYSSTTQGVTAHSFAFVANPNGVITPSYTVATLPTPSTVATGTLVAVTNASVAGSCTSGGGTALALCRNSGSAWVPIGDGTGSSSVGDAQNVQSYGAIGNGKFFTDGVSTGASNTLTSATAKFAATDVGNTVWCTVGALAGGSTININATVATYTNATTITYSGANGGNQSNLWCGMVNPLDSPAIISAFNFCKSVNGGVGLQSSRILTQPRSCNIYLPTGIYGISATLNGLVTTGNEIGVGILGDGIGQSVLMPTPTFTNGAGANQGWLLNGYGVQQVYRDWSVELTGWPTNFASDDVMYFQCTTCRIEFVGGFDFDNASGTTHYMMTAAGGTEVFIHPWLQNGGGTGISGGMNISSAANLDMFAPLFSNTTQNLTISGIASGNAAGGVRFYGGTIDEGSITTITTSVDVVFDGTTITGGANCLSVDSTSVVHLAHLYCGPFGGGTTGGITIASGGQVFGTDLRIKAQGTGNYCYNMAGVGGWVDLGGNNCTVSGGATTYNTGSFVTNAAVTHTYPEPFLPALPASGTALTIVAFTPQSAVSVKSLTIVSGNTPTCATPPTFQISNGTQSFTQTFASSSNVSGPTTPTQTVTNNAFPAGTQITLSITTAAYACATAPTNMNFAIEWQTTAPAL